MPGLRNHIQNVGLVALPLESLNAICRKNYRRPFAHTSPAGPHRQCSPIAHASAGSAAVGGGLTCSAGACCGSGRLIIRPATIPSSSRITDPSAQGNTLRQRAFFASSGRHRLRRHAGRHRLRRHAGRYRLRRHAGPHRLRRHAGRYRLRRHAGRYPAAASCRTPSAAASPHAARAAVYPLGASCARMNSFRQPAVNRAPAGTAVRCSKPIPPKKAMASAPPHPD